MKSIWSFFKKLGGVAEAVATNPLTEAALSFIPGGAAVSKGIEEVKAEIASIVKTKTDAGHGAITLDDITANLTATANLASDAMGQFGHKITIDQGKLNATASTCYAAYLADMQAAAAVEDFHKNGWTISKA